MHRKKIPNTTTNKPTVLSRRSFIKEIGIASVGCALFLSPWNLSAWNNNTRLETIQENKTMRLAQQSSQSTAADRIIPPIDAAAPEKTETATFSMG